MKLDLPHLLRGPAPLRRRDIAKGVAGAFVGIAATGLAAQAVRLGHWSAAPLLIPPIGASAVLVFAVPASPLAQPRAVIGGNILSAVIGAACALLIPQPAFAAAAAVALAILAMSLLGCLHPPGGAVALGVALAAQPAARRR